jgi:hypothetical protein
MIGTSVKSEALRSLTLVGQNATKPARFADDGAGRCCAEFGQAGNQVRYADAASFLVV